MSFIKNVNRIKNLTKNTQNCDFAEVHISSDDEFNSNFYLNTNGVFKMVVIRFSGKIKKFISLGAEGMSFKNHATTIIITNLTKSTLKDNLLFSYIGDINKIIYARIYSWGKSSQLAEITQPNYDEIKYDNNIVSDSDYVLTPKIIDIKAFSQTKPKRKNKSSRTITSVIEGLYTKGNDFLFKNKLYVGNYHYHPDKNQFMTGRKHTNKSVILKQRNSGRETNGL